MPNIKIPIELQIPELAPGEHYIAEQFIRFKDALRVYARVKRHLEVEQQYMPVTRKVTNHQYELRIIRWDDWLRRKRLTNYSPGESTKTRLTGGNTINFDRTAPRYGKELPGGSIAMHVFEDNKDMVYVQPVTMKGKDSKHYVAFPKEHIAEFIGLLMDIKTK